MRAADDTEVQFSFFTNWIWPFSWVRMRSTCR